MLSYEDSKRLKELGYGQELKEGDWAYGWRHRGYCHWDPSPPELLLFDDSDEYNLNPMNPYVKVPTTDGMIEGLKKSYSCFHTLSINIFDGGVSVEFILVDPVTQFLSAKITGFGDSVEQALCSVWKERKQ